MGEKIYKQITKNIDYIKLNRLVANYAKAIYIETWEDRDIDGIITDITNNGLAVEQAVNLTEKMYDSINSNNKAAELIIQDNKGECLTLYHTSKNKHGITYESLRIADSLIGGK